MAFPGEPPGDDQAQEKPPEPHPPEGAGVEDPEEPHWDEKTEKTFSVFVFPHCGQAGISLHPPVLNCSKVALQEWQRYSNIGIFDLPR